MYQKLDTQQKVSGIALLSVMIVVVAVSATASWLLYSQNLDITRMTRALSKEQAVLFALSFEEIAKEILRKDLSEQGERYDYYVGRTSTRTIVAQSWSEPAQWHRPMRPLLSELSTQGLEEVTICIYDLQGMINVNNLLWRGGVNPPGIKELERAIIEDEKKRAEADDTELSIKDKERRLAQQRNEIKRHLEREKIAKFFEEAEGNPQPYSAWYRARLVQHLRQIKQQTKAINLRDEDIQGLLDSLHDWLDGDENVRSRGAESSKYSFEQPPYQSANQPAHSINELYLIDKFMDLPLSGRETELGYEAGLQHIVKNLVALPRTSLKINLNTASLDVLRILPYLDKEDRGDILYNHINQVGPFQNMKQIEIFLEDELGLLENERYWAKWYLTVGSSFFSVYISLTIADHQIQTQSLMYRAAGGGRSQVYVLERHTVARDPYQFIDSEAQNCYIG